MRNEVFARYGFIFNDGGKMDTYFNLLSWYSPQHKNVDAFLTPLEKMNIALIEKLENKQPKDDVQLSQKEMESELIGSWSCNSSKMFSLDEFGNFHAKNFYKEERGSWWLTENKLYIDTDEDNDTITFEIDYMDREKMIIKSVDCNNWHEFFCQTGGDYRIYSTLYKDKPIGRNIKNALVGFWYNSEGFEFTNKGEYIHHGPDCGNGTWDYKDGVITVNESECGEYEKTFDLLTTQRLVVSENWTLFRMHKDESSIPTPKSEHK